jgi:peptidoglycan/LPS O-acetylase OafA/YrhL
MGEDGQRVSIPHVAALDGLRGLAVAGVLLFHGGHLTGGYLGVDLFFVLSGFLITSLLLSESRTRGRIALGGFWARRARRLLPALAGLLVGVAAYCVAVAQPAELHQIRGDALATIGYVANWHDAFAGQDYWALFRAPSPLAHTWSLAVEEQFYLVWPLIFVGLLAWWKRRTPAAVLVTALVLGAASSALMIVLYDPENVSRAYYGTDTRAAGVLAGAALAAALTLWAPARARSTRIAVEVLGFAGIATLFVAWTTLDGQSEQLYRGGFLVCNVAVVAVIAAATHPRRGPIGWALGFRPLCLLGLISYGVYLWHWPVDIVVDGSRTGLDGWALFVAQLSITLPIAIASYLVLEMPIRRGAITARQWRALIPATAAALVVVIVITTAGATGAPGEASARRRLGLAVSLAEHAPAGTRRILVVGDSVAWRLGSTFPGPSAGTDAVTANVGVPACVPIRGVSSVRYLDTGVVQVRVPTCDAAWSDAVRNFRPDTVLYVEWAVGRIAYEVNGQQLRPCDPRFQRRYREALQRDARRLGAGGAVVALTTYPYALGDAARPEARRQVDCQNTARRAVGRKLGLPVIELARKLCATDGRCETTQGSTLLRPDGVHFSGPGTRYINAWLATELYRADDGTGAR